MPPKIGESSSSDGVAEIENEDIFHPGNTLDSCKDNLTTEELSERDNWSSRPSSERSRYSEDRKCEYPM